MSCNMFISNRLYKKCNMFINKKNVYKQDNRFINNTNSKFLRIQSILLVVGA